MVHCYRPNDNILYVRRTTKHVNYQNHVFVGIVVFRIYPYPSLSVTPHGGFLNVNCHYFLLYTYKLQIHLCLN